MPVVACVVVVSVFASLASVPTAMVIDSPTVVWGAEFQVDEFMAAGLPVANGPMVAQGGDGDQTVSAGVAGVSAPVLGVSAGVAGVSAPAQQQDDAPFTLTILHNNDGESKLLPAPDLGYPGVAAFVETLRFLQAEAGEAVITLTSGDNFLASRELAVSMARSGPLYDSVALSGLYDAMALGNHDFDLGPEVAARFIEGFDPAVPFLSANLDVSGEPVLAALLDTGRLASSTVVDVAGEGLA